MAKVTLRQNFRAYPYESDKHSLDSVFNAIKYVKNKSLDIRSFAYSEFGLSLTGKDIKDTLPLVKKEIAPWLKDIPSQPLQEAVIDQDQAFERFFKGLGAYPKHQRRKDKQSFRLPQPKLIHDKQNPKWATLVIPKIDIKVPIRIHNRVQGELKSCTVIKNTDGTYEVSFVVKKVVHKFDVAKNMKAVALDVGIKHFVTMSDGTKIQAPKPFLNNLRKLKRLQRSLSRMKKRGKNWIKMKTKIAKLHSKIARQRKDFLHKLSSRIIRDNQVICIETLSVKNMIKNPKLSRSIADLGWGMFISMLKYKALLYGRSLRLIDRWFPSSKMCSQKNCGYINESLALKDREWTCACGAHHDRDVNAAINILTVGMDSPEYKLVTTKKLNRLDQKRASDDTLRGETQAASKPPKGEKASNTSRSRKAA